METSGRIAQIEAALGNRQLVYFGTRGADADALMHLANFRAVFSLVAPLAAATVQEISLESETKERVELDTYSIDADDRPVIGKLRREFLAVLNCRSAVLPYRPCAFLSSVLFPRMDRVDYLGLFHEKQSCFEHKAWVESQLASSGVPVLPWRYCADHEMDVIREWAATTPLVLRVNRTDGGVGVRLVRSPDDIETEWPLHRDGFLAAAPLLTPSIPLNVNGCVFRDGNISLHGPSLQLIGIEGLTNRRFGYCGNDFARTADLDKRVLDELEVIAVNIGHWLHSQGYRGAFGVDALIYDGHVHLMEVNPRFQGSSQLSARIDEALDRPSVFLEHIAAFLGLPCSPWIPLAELAANQPPFAHIIGHNVTKAPICGVRLPEDRPSMECRLLPATGVTIQPEAAVLDVVFGRSVTIDGMELSSGTRGDLAALLSSLFPDASGHGSGHALPR